MSKIDTSPAALRALADERGDETTLRQLLEAVADEKDQLLSVLKIALAEIKATGESEGYFFGDDPQICEKIEAVIAKAAPHPGEDHAG